MALAHRAVDVEIQAWPSFLAVRASECRTHVNRRDIMAGMFVQVTDCPVPVSWT